MNEHLHKHVNTPLNSSSCFTKFTGTIEHIPLPEKFTFPFYYDPHPLTLLASQELQDSIQNAINWEHDFGVADDVSDQALGKMFGVLVVKNNHGELGYLSAFSGNIDGHIPDSTFVPSISRFRQKDHFINESYELDQLSKQINKLQDDPKLNAAKIRLDLKTKEYSVKLSEEKREVSNESKKRKVERKKLKLEIEEGAYQILYDEHIQLSINDNFKYKAYSEYITVELAKLQSAYDLLNNKVIALKNQRKSKANELQDWLFAQYDFLNSKKESKNVVDLFKGRIPDVPPSGAGDCAAPKLLQYAYQEGYKPIALAEFWWGKAPSSKVRKHKYYYPACKGKCGPILKHMLGGLDVDSNPLLINPALGKELETVYEDEHLVVINKPAEFLSVPGKHISDSVQERMLEKYPNASGPMIVHRLDMSTSGLMVIALTKTVHKILQEQFKTRKIIKKYVALLDGVLENDSGFIDLPLRLDPDNRPFQLVCYEHGKPSRTKWEVIEKNEKTTKVYFYPLTGRTHQLRMHAAHKDGLEAPIIGDDLYGLKQDRLHLHAEAISFVHPVTKKPVKFEVVAEF